MKKLFIALCMAGVAAGFTACGTSRTAVASLDALNGEWKIVKVGDKDVKAAPGEKEAFIGLNVKEKRLYGNTSCNNLLGGFEADAKKGKISFGQAGSTRMMCPDMETEGKVLDAINKTRSFEMEKGGKLVFKSEDGKALMTMEKK